MSQTKKSQQVSLLLSGHAGQGMVTIEKILTHALKRAGYYVFATRGYMSRVRGGINTVQIRVSNGPVSAPVDHVDIFVPLDVRAFDYCSDRISSATRIITDNRTFDQCEHKKSKICRDVMHLPFMELAKEIGSYMYANTIVAGAILALFDVDPEIITDVIQSTFITKPKEVRDNNVQAVERGYKQGEHMLFQYDAEIALEQSKEVDDYVLLSGSAAVGLGAFASGCNFCSSYPMSPSTGVLKYIAKYGRECGVAVEQATDEIGAANMTIGANYAGAKSIVTTSGGGFALMEEAVSLAGMTETPLVIHLASRPGPATGLPTRTAQEDLNLMRYAGHGEFARAIYTPGSVAEAFMTTQHAFATAERYQTPAFVLTDQFLVDSLALAREEELELLDEVRDLVETDTQYLRYALHHNGEKIADGVSPRGVPGYGDGLVCADSDEHDESGHITEDFDVRKSMVQKRLSKLPAMSKEALMPTWTGLKKAQKVVIVWGSNKMAAQEAHEIVDNKDIAVCHFAQVYPLNPKVKQLLHDKEITVVENNATGQFADLLEKEIGVSVAHRKLKYIGTPFSVEEMVDIITHQTK